jgi:hypothetical protein
MLSFSLSVLTTHFGRPHSCTNCFATGTNATDLTSWEREARGLSNDATTTSSSSGGGGSSISTKTRIRDPYEITGEAPPLKLTRSMVFGKKGGMGLFGGNANGLIATDNTPPPSQPQPPPQQQQQQQQQQQSNTNASTGAVTVEAIYAFDAEQQDELSFGKGALVMDVTVKDDDW